MTIRTLIPLLWPPVIVLTLHVFRVFLAPHAYQYDMLAHFLGGAAIALVAWNIERALIREHHLHNPPIWLSWFLCIATAELVGVLWEFWEFFVQSRFIFMGMTLRDTMGDLLLDLAGAITLTTILAWKKRRG